MGATRSGRSKMGVTSRNAVKESQTENRPSCVSLIRTCQSFHLTPSARVDVHTQVLLAWAPVYIGRVGTLLDMVVV